MTLMLIWGFLIVLLVAVAFLFWFQFKNKQQPAVDPQVLYLEEKVLHLESHLKKSLEIMQDLAKKMHVQQEVLDRTVANIAALEKQNVESVNVLEVVVKNFCFHLFKSYLIVPFFKCGKVSNSLAVSIACWRCCSLSL